MMNALLAGVILSLASSLHCVGMCGPLALAIKLNFKDNDYFSIVYYHLGRLLAYLILGSIAMMFGKSLLLFVSSQFLSIAIGAAILIGLVVSYFWNKSAIEIKALNKLRIYFMAQAHPFLIGIGNGLIPCGLVYTALGLSVAYSSSNASMIFMLGFGIGTFPATAIIQLLGKRLNLKRFIRPVLSKVVIAVIAVLFVFRGLNLGVPYLSPEIVQDHNQAEVNCCKK
jgi:hypothetical protein